MNENIFSEITKDHLRHAYLIEGDARELAEPLLAHLGRELSIVREENPDVLVFTPETLDVTAARDIRAASRMTGISQGQRIFIIGARAFTHEAQNALLKTLEEPIAGTLFFIIVPTKELLLPTVRSRLISLAVNAAEYSVGDLSLAEQFFQGHAAERLKIVSAILQEEDKDFARDRAKAFLAALIRAYGRRADRNPRYLERLLLTRKRLYIPSSSLKFLLEGVALTFSDVVLAEEKK